MFVSHHVFVLFCFVYREGGGLLSRGSLRETAGTGNGREKERRMLSCFSKVPIPPLTCTHVNLALWMARERPVLYREIERDPSLIERERERGTMNSHPPPPKPNQDS